RGAGGRAPSGSGVGHPAAAGGGGGSVSLAPVLNPPPAIQLHAFSALAAFGLGAVQLAAPKGTLPHRTLGWIWVVLMVVVAASSFWIHELRVWGPWSPIHLLAIFTLAMLPLAVLHARRHRVGRHRNAMIAIFPARSWSPASLPSCPAASCTWWCSGLERAPQPRLRRGPAAGSDRAVGLDHK